MDCGHITGAGVYGSGATSLLFPDFVDLGNKVQANWLGSLNTGLHEECFSLVWYGPIQECLVSKKLQAALSQLTQPTLQLLQSPP